jgi:hypothetical protein
MLTIPAEIGAGQLRDLQRIRGGAGAKGRLASGEYVLEVDGASFFAGRLALEQSAEASSARGDVTRYWSGHTLRLLMVLAGALIKESSFTLRVVTGLPIIVWDIATTVPPVQHSLCGTHSFRLNAHTRSMTVEAVLVVMEGAGALALHGVADDVPQAVINTGGRTTNLFWAQGQRPVLPRCAGFAWGVGDVGDLLAAWFLDQYGRELSPIERREILWSAAQHKSHRPIFVDGQPVKLESETQRFIAPVDPDNRLVAAELEQRWESALRALEQAEATCTQPRPPLLVLTLSAELREQFQAIGQHLPQLWQQGLIGQAHKKALLRCLIDKVVIQRTTRDWVQARIVWKGGETTTLDVAVPVGSFADLAGAATMEQIILEQSALGISDEEIARHLTAQGYRSPMREEVLASTVKTIRLKHRLFQKRSQSHPWRIAGWLTVPQIAMALGLSPHWIYDRIYNGSIQVVKDPERNVFLFPDEPATLEQFKALKEGTLKNLRF